MLDLKILYKRDKLSKIVLTETVVITVVSIIQFCGIYPEYGGSKYDLFFLFSDKTVAYSFVMLLIIPIIGSLPYSDSYFVENNLRYNIISKVGKKKYYFSKYLTCFITGFLNCLFVFELAYLFQILAINNNGNVYCSNGALNFDFLFPESYKVYFSNMIINHPYLLVQIDILFICLFSGTCGCLSYALSQVISIKGLVYVNSFLVTFSISFILQYVGMIGFLLAYFNVFRFSTSLIETSPRDLTIVVICILWVVFNVILTTIIQLVVDLKNE